VAFLFPVKFSAPYIHFLIRSFVTHVFGRLCEGNETDDAH